MPTELYMRRALDRLVPVDHLSADLLRNFAQGKALRVTVVEPRNIKHHRMYWALVAAIFPHQKAYATADDLHDALKLACGYFDMVRNPLTGRKYPKTRSIAFDKMDQAQFSEFFNRAVEVVLTRIVPGVDKADLQAQIEDILAGSKVDEPKQQSKREHSAR